jgi:hypothetical protein
MVDFSHVLLLEPSRVKRYIYWEVGPSALSLSTYTLKISAVSDVDNIASYKTTHPPHSITDKHL